MKNSLLILQSESVVNYQEALDFQLKLLDKKKSDSDFPNILWLLSHSEVFTLGSNKTSLSNLLEKTHIETVKVRRGGDITYHDSGQITGYLIFTLEEQNRDLKKFLYLIEEAIIDALILFKMKAKRVPKKTGVFIGDKKVCSIGIACKHWITYHGFSINFNSNLENYKKINPCGFSSSIMDNLISFTNEPKIKITKEIMNQIAIKFNQTTIKKDYFYPSSKNNLF